MSTERYVKQHVEYLLPENQNNNVKVKVKSLSRVRFFATLRTAAYQAPPSMGFPGKSAAVDCHFLLQGIFPTQELNPALLHCRQMLYRLSHQGSYCGTIPLAGSHCDLVIAGKSFTLLISIFINS